MERTQCKRVLNGITDSMQATQHRCKGDHDDAEASREFGKNRSSWLEQVHHGQVHYKKAVMGSQFWLH